MEKLASDVQDGEIADCGFYIPEEQPEELARRMLDFLLGCDEILSSCIGRSMRFVTQAQCSHF